MDFQILSDITEIETIAIGHRIRELDRLQKTYRNGRWRKRKGKALICLADGATGYAELHWYEASGIGKKDIKNQTTIGVNNIAMTTREFAICIGNEGYAASLELWKVYAILPDAEAKRHRYLRIIDESGEDYLYPEEYFVPLTLPKIVEDAMNSNHMAVKPPDKIVIG